MHKETPNIRTRILRCISIDSNNKTLAVLMSLFSTILGIGFLTAENIGQGYHLLVKAAPIELWGIVFLLFSMLKMWGITYRHTYVIDVMISGLIIWVYSFCAISFISNTDWVGPVHYIYLFPVIAESWSLFLSIYTKNRYRYIDRRGNEALYGV